MLEECRRRIKALLAQPGMTKTFLAHKAGIPRNSLIGYEKAKWNPSSLTLDALMAAVKGLEK